MSDKEMEAMDSEVESNDIAIIGMACRFPGAQTPDEFWDNLKHSREALRGLSDEELRSVGVSERDIDNPNYVKAGMFLKDMKCFDAGFFGFNPQEAKIMDPQHRHFLECAWETFEDAGYVPDQFDGAVGVFAGSGHNAYMPYNLLDNKELLDQVGFFLLRHTGNDKDFLSTRASYLFDLKGPSINVQTACSTSLVAVHSAAQSLLSGECDMALAGGVTIELPEERGYLYKESEILSKDGHCRPFEASSGGTVFGSGVGCVLLKRLDDALADGDHIHAILKSSAINNDGANKVSYLAPSVDGQVAAIREAIEIADIDPASVGFVECHGTGTQMGDPIEVAALTQAYGIDNPKTQYCALGSVKSNIGHLDTAAGAAGMIKAIMSLKHKQMVPTLHYQTPNPAIDFANSPFFVNDRLRDWTTEEPRRAAVSSLGVGGTNAHLILEEPPVFDDTTETAHRVQLLTLSAKNESALTRMASRLSEFLSEKPDLDLADVAYTLNKGRKDFEYRMSFALNSTQDAIDTLADLQKVSGAISPKVQDEPSLVFMFPGGGAQYSGMGVDLYASEPVYREAFDACMACLPADVSDRVRSLVFAPEGEREKATTTLQTPTLTLTSLFATEYALAKQMFSWGAKPSAMIGHSMGENTAACLAGVLSLHDAMNLVHLRGQLFERAPEGGMLSIPLPVEEARGYMSDDLDVAAINASELCVATGPKKTLMDLQKKLEQDDIDSTVVRINVAAHSRMLDDILDDFRAYLNSIKLSPPTIPFTSNLTGTWITDAQAVDPNYWVDHLRNTVKFAENVETVISGDARVLVEIGPGKTLTNLAKANVEPGTAVMSSMRHPNEDEKDEVVAKKTLGAIWTSGAAVDWAQYWGEEYRFRVSLPTYPFEKKVHWVDAVEHDLDSNSRELRKLEDQSKWYAKLAWREFGLSGTPLDSDSDIVIFSNSDSLCDSLSSYLEKFGHVPIIAKKGAQFSSLSETHYQLSPGNEKEFFMFSERCLEQSEKPLKIYYMWSMELPENRGQAEEASFWGLFNLLKVLAELDRSVELCVVSNQFYSLTGEKVNPLASLALGPVLITPRELPHVNARIVDVRPNLDNTSLIASQLTKELSIRSDDTQVLYRGRGRWVRRVQPTSLEGRTLNAEWVKKDSTVLISGGLGGIGLNMARLMTQKGAKRVVLMSRRELPPQSEWNELQQKLDASNPLYYQLHTLSTLLETNTEIITVAADVTQRDSISSAFERAGISTQDIDIVIHAAGIMDDKLLIEKTTEEARKVMSAKVSGAIALDQLFLGANLDRFVVFSSVASYLGLPGQIDYTSANAFLDAFAAERNDRESGTTVAINWSAWKEVGMAANVGRNTQESITVDGTLLDAYFEDGPQQRIYTIALDAQEDWLVQEHQTRDGFHLVPGTGFIELFRSACTHFLERETSSSLSIRELSFMSAFEVPRSGQRTLNIAVQQEEGALVVSAFAEDVDVPLATAQVVVVESQVDKRDLASIQGRCLEDGPTKERFMDQEFMDFGPRWACIEGIKCTAQEALVTICLPELFTNDLSDCELHPALLDMATGCAQFLQEGFDKLADFYVPVSYQSIAVYGALPQRFFSHIRLRSESGNEQLHFDVDMMDEEGVVLAQVVNFSMQKLDHGFTTTLSHGEDSGSATEELTPEQERLAEILREAIKPEEGIQAFEHAMSLIEEDSQLIIASIDTELWQHQLRDQFSQEQNETAAENEEPLHDADIDPDIPTIESVLLKNAGVEQAVVRSFVDESGQRRLIAYYCQDDWESITVTELRSYVKQTLEKELVPQQFVLLDELPSDDQGEVDRSQLLDPFAPVDHHIPPHTQTEKKLAKIWQAILGVSRVGLNENFFDIGGHSLLSIRVIVKVKKVFGVRLDQAKMVLLTLEQLAKEIDDQSETAPKTVAASDSPEEPVLSEVESQSTDISGKKGGIFSSMFKKRK